MKTLGEADFEALYRSESRKVLATLVRLLGDFDLAEEAMHDAFAIALQKWEIDGVPDNPRAWLISTARFKAIDQLRRQARFDYSIDTVINELVAEENESNEQQIEELYQGDMPIQEAFIKSVKGRLG